jgi:hypothetical protein
MRGGSYPKKIKEADATRLSVGFLRKRLNEVDMSHAF